MKRKVPFLSVAKQQIVFKKLQKEFDENWGTGLELHEVLIFWNCFNLPHFKS